MPSTIQIRSVSEELHEKLKARAAQADMSLSRYLLHEIKKVANQPTIEELRARIATRARVETRESAADIIRAMRDAG